MAYIIILILLGVIFNLKKKIKQVESLSGSIAQKENELKTLTQTIGDKVNSKTE